MTPADAATLFGAFEQLCAVHGVRPPAGLDRMIYSRNPMLQLREQLSPEAFAAATERGKRLSLDEAVALAVESLTPPAAADPAAAAPDPS
jgi:hypothetical protein